MKKIQFAALFILMLVSALKVNAQFTNYDTINSDLPSNYVCGGVAIDTNNNVWVGTDAGVAKFDGSWTVFTTADGLPSNIISCIAVDINNDIWIGTDGDGVAKYNGTIWTTYTYADGLCDNGIHYIVCDADSNIWFGSWGAGVSKFKNGIWTTYNDVNGFPNDAGTIATVYYITSDESNNKWFGTDMGLVKYDNSTFTTINQTTVPELRSNYITAVAIDDFNNKWLGVLSKGMAKFNNSNVWIANYDTLNGICNNGVTDIKIDPEGNIWLGEYTIYGSLVVGGITKFNSVSGSGVSLSETDGLINDQVFRIAVDQNNNIWIATGEGLSMYTDEVGIEEENSNAIIDIYPNPTHEFLNINCSIQSGIAEIFDITGRVFYYQSISLPAIINTENLVDGVYFIRIKNNETNFYGKFIKE